MSEFATSRATLAATLWPAHGHAQKFGRVMILAIAGSLLLTLSAKVHIPFWPVPMTLQTLAVLVIGMAYGPRLGGATLLLYLAEGAIGLPVFSGTPERGIGLAYLAGPTGGYLVGFVLAAALVGVMAERGWDRSPVTAVTAMVVGNLVIYVCGVAWLGAIIGYGGVWSAGVEPFLLGDGIKIALGAALLPACWKILGNRPS